MICNFCQMDLEESKLMNLPVMKVMHDSITMLPPLK